MSIRLTGRHIEISPKLKTYIEKKLEKLDRYAVHIVDSELILYQENNFAWAEGILHLAQMFNPIDECGDLFVTQAQPVQKRFGDIALLSLF